MKYILIINLLLFVSSCKIQKSNKISHDDSVDTQSIKLVLDESDFLIVGSYEGRCFDNSCIVIYKHSANFVYKDNAATRPTQTGNYAGTFHHKINNMSFFDEILKNFPKLLLSETNGTKFGCPNCTDQGGFYIEIKKDDMHKNFLLDKNVQAVPKALQNFVKILLSEFPSNNGRGR